MSHQESKDKPRSSKCRHFCLPFDSHNYYPACRESNKGDDPSVTLEKPCEICLSFSEEQSLKIKNRRRYVQKQKATDMSKDDDLDFLGDEDVEFFLALMQTLKVLLNNYLPLPHILNPCVLRLCHLKLPLNLPHLLQVLPYSQRLNLNLRNLWVLNLTANFSNKWVPARLLCMKQ